MTPQTTFIGIDVSGGRHPFTCAVLDADGRLLDLRGGEMEDILAFVGAQPSAFVTVNAPPRPNRGLVSKRLNRTNPGHLRGTDMRLAEFELRQRGIHISATPGREALCLGWLQLGFELHRRLAGMGFQSHPAGEGASRQILETHPHAAFCVLLEGQPLPKPMLEGRLQRQSLLHDRRLEIKDPMDFFEEITRRKLLRGLLPMEFVYAPEELDALVAAYTAYVAAIHPGESVQVGDVVEGQITLPVARLKEEYV